MIFFNIRIPALKLSAAATVCLQPTNVPHYIPKKAKGQNRMKWLAEDIIKIVQT